jgi:hypothetical protein
MSRFAFGLIISFSFYRICQMSANIAKPTLPAKNYSLTNGTKAIRAKLNQPLTLKLYYARTARMKGPDQIRYSINYMNS